MPACTPQCSWSMLLAKSLINKSKSKYLGGAFVSPQIQNIKKCLDISNLYMHTLDSLHRLYITSMLPPIVYKSSLYYNNSLFIKSHGICLYKNILHINNDNNILSICYTL